MQYPVIAGRNLMLATCEDSIHHKGNIDTAVDGGVYFRAVWAFGFSHSVFERYFSMIWELHQKNPAEAFFPEWIVQQIDQDWMTSYPTPQETAYYQASLKYVESLMGKLGAGDGKAVELLAHYLLSVIPGCRAHRRQFTHSTDLDVAGAFEGPVQDFRNRHRTLLRL